ncbi:MAG: tRNA lysidine(34) synthetase TilS [Candidatus Endonucleobacter bathymodioli]|uniref:tRNA(Ile)-lysidine synthase n=1 Tax=Candidatus Endonucleibacter bathymodioli TaxID=539814 RepID=A0AA90NX79_9GAMM|nr:tRNA lysidine(34) synthetase TilS [Candidatus Endonucleobacter bathymodioli]
MGLLAESLLKTLESWLGSSLVVAFSGGVDSTTLLHSLVSLRDAKKIAALKAIHINHSLSDNASEWQKHCQNICDLWSVELKIVRVHISNIEGEGLEQAARSARYKAFNNELKADECLLQGHHLNDQAETVLLRLFRGTGVTGLSGMPFSRALGKATLLRPLLAVSRREIECYASEHSLQYIEDESNQNQHFSRNYLRHSLLPAIENRWPGAAVRLSALASELVAVNAQLDERTSELAQLIIVTRPQWLLGNQPILEIEQLAKLPLDSQKQVIRFWLKLQQLPVPGREVLGKIITEVIKSRRDANPLLCWTSCELRRYKGMLCASHPLPEIKPIADIYWNWAQEPYFFHEELGYLYIREAKDTGMKAIILPKGALEVRTRESIDSSLRISVAGRIGRKSLKRWLQEFDVPPWLRSHIPFLFFQNQMVAAPGLWLCSEFTAKDEGGHHVQWSRTQLSEGVIETVPE